MASGFAGGVAGGVCRVVDTPVCGAVVLCGAGSGCLAGGAVFAGAGFEEAGGAAGAAGGVVTGFDGCAADGGVFSVCSAGGVGIGFSSPGFFLAEISFRMVRILPLIVSRLKRKRPTMRIANASQKSTTQE